MTDIITQRRSFITGIASLIAAPAIVKASNLMPIKVIEHYYDPRKTLIQYDMRDRDFNLFESENPFSEDYAMSVNYLIETRPDQAQDLREKIGKLERIYGIKAEIYRAVLVI